MSLKDWNEEEHRVETAEEKGRPGDLSRGQLIAFIALAALYVVLVMLLLDALKI